MAQILAQNEINLSSGQVLPTFQQSVQFHNQNHIVNREQAIQILKEIADYFQMNEPHSPVSYMLQKTITWSQMPLHEWLTKVIKNENPLEHLHELLGVPAQNESSCSGEISMFKAEKYFGVKVCFKTSTFSITGCLSRTATESHHSCDLPFAHGIQSIEFDEAQLGMQILALNKVEMIWQDGEIYQAPAKDLLPEPVQLDTLNLQGEMQIYLALPMVQPNKQNVSHADQARPSRYHSHLSSTHDLFTDASTAEITLLRRRAELKIFEGSQEPQHHMDGYLYLPVGRIKRQSSGNFIFDHKFIPPVLHIQANENLLVNLQRTLNIIQAKIKTIQSNNRENEQKLIEFRSGDIVSFWLVNALNTAYASLNHILQYPIIHPERLYSELLRLTGSLLTFRLLMMLINCLNISTIIYTKASIS